MKKFVLYQIDSFTRSKFKGNSAGVIVNADGLSAEQMQMIARELNNSETAFLLSPDSNDCDGQIRYFSPLTEVPICGHATIAAMHAKALEDNLGSCVLRVKTGVGILPFEIEQADGHTKIWMAQGAVNIEPELTGIIRQQLLDNLGLTSDDLCEDHPIQIASTGHSKVMIGISSRKKLNNLQPDFRQLSALSQTIGCNGYFVFVPQLSHPVIQTHGRMFAPAIGINEDPVTGNAHGPLGAYFVHNQLVDTRAEFFNFTGVQGEAIGRKGSVDVQVSIQNKQPVAVKIAGEAVVIFKTIIEL